MARVVRSPLAKRDIVDVLAFTRRHWGADQALAYAALIRDAISALAEDAACGRPRDDLRRGLRAYHLRERGQPARHVLFYMQGDDRTVVIVRLLHDSMDFERHLR